MITMVKTKGLARTQANWESAIGGVPQKYKDGVQAATNVIENAIAAEDLYAERVSQAIANKSRVKGLQKTSTAEWKEKASGKGAERIATGMNASKAKFGTGMGKVLAVIEGTEIGPRTGDVVANITNRVVPIAVNLRNAKEQGNL
jgi:hypothetical protein